MIEEKEKMDLSKRGHWYETRGGTIYLCVRFRMHGKNYIKKFEMPVGVRELKASVVPAD